MDVPRRRTPAIVCELLHHREWRIVRASAVFLVAGELEACRKGDADP
jgi:hypothetical protein